MEDHPTPPSTLPPVPPRNVLSQTKPIVESQSRRPRAVAAPGKKTRGKKDALTGLYDQRYLGHAIDKCLKQSRSRDLTATLALLQLENFYEIRTWVGPSEADLLLADIARVLKQTLPQHVLLCRCPNYEFAALLLADASVKASLITGKLKQALLTAVSPVLPPQLELNCGVGLAQLEANIPSWPVVFARARHNLRLAHHHSDFPSQLPGIGPDAALKQLQQALTQSELVLNYQAWAHFSEDSSGHYEVRCTFSGQPDSLPTALLFETAARNALGEQLDRRIIEQVLARCSKEADENLRLVINLSHNSVVSLSFLRWLEDILGSGNALAERLVFQISEIDALIAQHHLNNFCELIEGLGSSISLSNFGCTPNPLRYLSLVPARYVKLDISLYDRLEVNQGQLDNLTALCSQLHEKKIAVVASLLERDALIPGLWQARVDYLQGHCLHPPGSAMNYSFLQTHSVGFD